ncbi:MAG: hypothetical protein KGZ83_17085 [Sulfuricella sp.]|nr:hypothetical protein [Sulfuricella sp.]
MDDTTNSTPAPRSRPSGGLRRAFCRAHAWLRAYRHEVVILTLISAIAFIFLLPFTYHSIPAGHVGVLWKRFGGGTVTDEVYPEGYRLTFPWDLFYIYDARLQKVEKEIEVLTSDGLQIKLLLVWRFHLLPETVGLLHKFAGPNYAETMVTPTVGARTRDVIAIYQPDEVYTERRLKIQEQILEAVRYDIVESFNFPGTKVKWLEFEDVLIKGMTLPPGVQDAIVRKNAVFHEMEEYTFRVQKEQKEAERKRIEAVGIRNFQEIVSNGMSDSYLRWRGIEATIDLAKSNNAKVVVIGNAKNGLPLILNMDGKESLDLPGATPPKASVGKTEKAPN